MADLLFRALQHVWSTLASLNLPVALMGGIAVSVWKHVRATHDVDLLVGIETAELDIVLARLADAGIRPKRQPPVLSLDGLRIVQLLYEPPGAHLDLQIDLLLAETDFHWQSLQRRIPAQLPDLAVEVEILTCEDLILYKLLAGRIVDRADAAALLRANRVTLDFVYLSSQLRQLGLGQQFAEIWDEAFPGEASPMTL